MPNLPACILTLREPLAHLFDARTWRKVQSLVVGTILEPLTAHVHPDTPFLSS